MKGSWSRFILELKYIFPFTGTAYGSLDFPKLTFSREVNLRAGNNKIALLSIAVGLPVSFLPLEEA